MLLINPFLTDKKNEKDYYRRKNIIKIQNEFKEKFKENLKNEKLPESSIINDVYQDIINLLAKIYAFRKLTHGKNKVDSEVLSKVVNEIRKDCKTIQRKYATAFITTNSTLEKSITMLVHDSVDFSTNSVKQRLATLQQPTLLSDLEQEEKAKIEEIKLATFNKENASFIINKDMREDEFNQIVKWIRQAEAYDDPFSKIIIEDDKVYFGHSLNEIAASFPIIEKIFKHSLTEENILRYSINFYYKNPDRTLLISDANDYLKNLSVKTVDQSQYSGIRLDNPNHSLLDLVSRNEGVILGEAHSDQASKKLLFDNMYKLKQAGVKTIYFEHILTSVMVKRLRIYSKFTPTNRRFFGLQAVSC